LAAALAASNPSLLPPLLVLAVAGRCLLPLLLLEDCFFVIAA